MVNKAPQHAVCETCPLYDGCITPCMPGAGSEDPTVMLIGESPGENEDKQGEPFVGQSGKLLRASIESVGINLDDCRFTNAVRCRPPKNRTPTNKEVENCSGFLFDEIKAYDPRVVVLLGNTPLKIVLGESGITTWNGVVVERGGTTYIPAYHPAYIMRGMNDELLNEWLMALGKAAEVSNNGASSVPTSAESGYEFVYPLTTQEVLDMRNEIIEWAGESGRVVAYDVETRWLEEFKPGNAIVSCSLAIDKKVWSLPLKHPEAPWDEVEYKYVVSQLEEVLQSVPIIGHNIRFDSRMTRRMLGIEIQAIGDTMRVSQLIDSRVGIHGLKRLAGLYVGMYDYDRELNQYKAEHREADPGKGGDFGKIPLGILLPYGAKDAVATYALFYRLEGDLTDKQKVLHEQMIMPADYALGNIESSGFRIDKYITLRYYTLYQMAADKYKEQMLKDKQVKQFIEDKQAASKKFKFNPNSGDQMAAVFYQYKKHKVTDRTATGKPSVAIDTLKQSSVSKDSLFEPYRKWRLLASMLSKYLGPAIKGEWEEGAGDDRVHASFNMGGAKTGRLSSSSPNLQNIPTPESESGTLLSVLPIKNIFTHTWDDGCLAAFDYSGMELRVMASVASCQGMIDAFSNGLDIHKYVTGLLYNVPYEEITKEQRYRGKWVSWSTIYGGSAHTLHNLYDIPLSEAESLINGYFEQFPEILDYQESTASFAKSSGYVESSFGRRLYLPYINDRDRRKAEDDKRTALNMPIQGLSSDMLLCALIVIDCYRRERGMKTLIVNTVHDSLVADVFPGELDKFATMCVGIMENLPTYAPVFFPRLDFSWLKCKLKVDVETGSHYGALEPYEVNRADT